MFSYNYAGVLVSENSSKLSEKNFYAFAASSFDFRSFYGPLKFPKSSKLSASSF